MDFIFIAGCPGVGKTTVSRLIHRSKQESWPLIDFGRLREFHLNSQWTNQSEIEEQMAFENLIYILKNYHRYSYQNILINDLNDQRIQTIAKYLSPYEYRYMIITLLVSNADILSTRVLNPERDSGWRNVQKSIEINEHIRQRERLEQEFFIDTTYQTPEQTMSTILKIYEEFTMNEKHSLE